MALDLQIEATMSYDGTQILIGERTGVYNGSTNPGGWGTPNAALGDATAASIEIFDHDNESLLVVDAFGDLPVTTTNAYDIIVEETDLGETDGDAIPDKFLTIVYTVTAGGVDYTATTWLFIDTYMKSQINDKLGSISVSNYDEESDLMEQALDFYRYYKAVQKNVDCGQITKAQTLYLLLVNEIANFDD